MLPKSASSRFQRSIHNETEEDAIAKAAVIDDDMEDHIAVFMMGWDDSSDAQRVPLLSSEKKNQSSTRIMKDSQQQKDCQRVSWHKTVYPNCNTFHEFDLSKVLLDETTAYVGYVRTLPFRFRVCNWLNSSLVFAFRTHDASYFSHAKCSGGSYRQVYLAETQPVPVVIKVMGLDDDSYMGIRNVGEFLMDGVVGAAVSKNPYLTEMYGFCRYERSKCDVEYCSNEQQRKCVPSTTSHIDIMVLPSLSYLFAFQQFEHVK
jgi:hypothetical protein